MNMTDASKSPESSRDVNTPGGPKPPPLYGKNPDGREFDAGFTEIPGVLTIHAVLERLLKNPAAVVYELVEGRRVRAMAALLVLTLLCFMGYGLIMGSFSAGEQLLVVPLKIAAGVLLSLAICLPSLYIFSCFAGGRQSLGSTMGLAVLALAMWSVLLVGFAPIAWLFSQSTESIAFMGAMHLLFWLIAAYFGLNLMYSAFAHLNGRSLSILRVWGFIFVIVTMQVATMLRPLVGKAAPMQLVEKKFFLAHWMDCVDGRETSRR